MERIIKGTYFIYLIYRINLIIIFDWIFFYRSIQGTNVYSHIFRTPNK